MVARGASRNSINRPKRNRAEQAAALPASVELTLVETREVDTPADETPLYGRLLTTRAAEDLAGAQKFIELYRQRWQIEQVFRVMKTRGFDIEAVPIEENAPLKTWLVRR